MQCLCIFSKEHHEPSEYGEKREDSCRIPEKNDEKRGFLSRTFIDERNVIGTVAGCLPCPEHEKGLYDDQRDKDVKPTEGFVLRKSFAPAHDKVEDCIHDGHYQHKGIGDECFHLAALDRQSPYPQLIVVEGRIVIAEDIAFELK